MILEAVGLSRRVGDRVLFDSIDLSLEEGETIAVCGASGAGKTLLLRALAWLDPIESGRLALAGKAPEAWGAPTWRAHVTYVAQRPPVLAGTPAEFAATIARLATQSSRARDDPRSLAVGWGLARETWDRPWSSLSGGEQARAALAVAVVREPTVLLLDEPTAALDDEATARVESDLRGRTLVWVTHDLAQAHRVSTRVLGLNP